MIEIQRAIWGLLILGTIRKKGRKTVPQTLSCEWLRTAEPFRHARSGIDRQCHRSVVQLLYSRAGSITARALVNSDCSVLSRGCDVDRSARMAYSSLVDPRCGFIPSAELIELQRSQAQACRPGSIREFDTVFVMSRSHRLHSLGAA